MLPAVRGGRGLGRRATGVFVQVCSGYCNKNHTWAATTAGIYLTQFWSLQAKIKVSTFPGRSLLPAHLQPTESSPDGRRERDHML